MFIGRGTIIGILTGIAVGFLLAAVLPASHPVKNILKNEKNALVHPKEMRNKNLTGIKHTNSSNIKQISSVVTTKKPKYIPRLDEDWGKVKCPFTKLSKKGTKLYDYINEITLPCELEVMVGGFFTPVGKSAYFDGQKYMCLDPSFNIKYKNCLTLSFGISTDWSYDDEMDKVFGCKVYSFDHTINKENHNRSKNISFFKMGISNKPGGGGKLNSYSGILKMLKLENKVIDYLKMDVEGAEWPFFQDVLTNTPNLLKNVKQIGMEIHLGGLEAAWRSFQHLDCLGFKMMFMHNNPVAWKKKINGKWISNLYEVVWGQDRKW